VIFPARGVGFTGPGTDEYEHDQHQQR
jgi:hypothetical protein